MLLRWLESLLPWALLGAALVVLHVKLTPPAHGKDVLDIASMLGMALLALPAVRINEQARLIDRVRRLQTGIQAIEQGLADTQLADDIRQRQQATLRERKDSLQSSLDELSTGKGTWTRSVHTALYGGYVLLLGTAVARVVT